MGTEGEMEQEYEEVYEDDSFNLKSEENKTRSIPKIPKHILELRSDPTINDKNLSEEFEVKGKKIKIANPDLQAMLSAKENKKIIENKNLTAVNLSSSELQKILSEEDELKYLKQTRKEFGLDSELDSKEKTTNKTKQILTSLNLIDLDYEIPELLKEDRTIIHAPQSQLKNNLKKYLTKKFDLDWSVQGIIKDKSENYFKDPLEQEVEKEEEKEEVEQEREKEEEKEIEQIYSEALSAVAKASNDTFKKILQYKEKLSGSKELESKIEEIETEFEKNKQSAKVAELTRRELMETALKPITREAPQISNLIENITTGPLFKLGNYNVFEQIGQGAFCDVYRAESDTGREVCIKILRDSNLRNKLIKQIKTNHKLNHRYIVPIEHHDLTADQPWFVMRYVKGGHLNTQNKRNLETSLLFFNKVCEAIAYAHSQGVIHKDIKPANILVDKNGENESPAVTDLGLSSIINSDSLDQSLVTAISGAGTFGYMAPEDLNSMRRGNEIKSTKQSDIFALGTLLYELLTYGDLPSTNVEEELNSRGIDKQLTQIVKKATAKNPQNRYESVDELQDDLAKIVIESQTNKINKFRKQIIQTKEKLEPSKQNVAEELLERGDTICGKIRALIEETSCDLKFKCKLSKKGKFEFNTLDEELETLPYYTKKVLIRYEKSEEEIKIHVRNPKTSYPLFTINKYGVLSFTKLRDDEYGSTMPKDFPWKEIHIKNFFDYLAENPQTTNSKFHSEMGLVSEVLTLLPDAMLSAYKLIQPHELKEILSVNSKSETKTNASRIKFARKNKAIELKNSKIRGQNLEQTLLKLFFALGYENSEFETVDNLIAEYDGSFMQSELTLTNGDCRIISLKRKRNWYLGSKLEMSISQKEKEKLGLKDSRYFTTLPNLFQDLHKNPVNPNSTQARARKKFIDRLVNLPKAIRQQLEGEEIKRNTAKELSDLETKLIQINESIRNQEAVESEIELDAPFIHVYGSKKSQIRTKHNKLKIRYFPNGHIQIWAKDEDHRSIMDIDGTQIHLNSRFYSLENHPLKGRFTVADLLRHYKYNRLSGNELKINQEECILEILRKLDLPPPDAKKYIQTEKKINGPLGKIQEEYSLKLKNKFTKKIQIQLHDLLTANLPNGFNFTLNLDEEFTHIYNYGLGNNQKVELPNLKIVYLTKEKREIQFWTGSSADTYPIMKLDREGLHFEPSYNSLKGICLNYQASVTEYINHIAKRPPLGDALETKQQKCILDALEKLHPATMNAVKKELNADD